MGNTENNQDPIPDDATQVLSEDASEIPEPSPESNRLIRRNAEGSYYYQMMLERERAARLALEVERVSLSEANASPARRTTSTGQHSA